MAQPTFFATPPASTLGDIAALTKALLVDPSRAGQQIRGLASLDEAGPMHLAFFDNLKYADQLASTKAGACLVSPRFEKSVPAHVAVLRAAQPFRTFVQLAREWHRDALRPTSWFGQDGIAPSAIIDPSARLEDGVIVDPMALIGADVEIAPSVDSNLAKLLFDPQTAGGMLIAIAESKAEALLNNLTQNYPHARAIGRVLPESARKIIVSK